MENHEDWIAEWASTKPLTRQWTAAGEAHSIRQNALIVVTDGHGVWRINGDSVHVAFGQLIAVKEGSSIEVVEGGAPDLAGWQALFRVRAPLGSGQETGTAEWRLPADRSWYKVQLSGATLTALGPYLQENAARSAVRLRIDGQLFLYELLRHVYEESPSGESTVEERLQRTIAYMQEHYNEALTRKQLAQIAGLSPWHYSRKFNEYRSMPPLEFLARYRMYRAQELLLLTSATTQHIAWQVGFEDVHYFSRRFKQLTGVSPRNYGLHPASRRIVALTPLCADMLIRFGAIPHAVAATPLLLTERQLRQLEEHRIKLLPSPQFHLDTELIARTQPDLIIGPFITEEVRMRLRAIAPIISVDHSDAELLIQQLAALFDKEAEGRSLLAQMQREREAARSKLSPSSNPAPPSWRSVWSRSVIVIWADTPREFPSCCTGISDCLCRSL